MNCRNCGAPLKYLKETQSYNCPFCHAMEVTIETLRGIVLLEEKSNFNCPLCHVPLDKMLIDNNSGLYCTSCHGLLLSRRIFIEIVEFRRSHTLGEGAILVGPRKDEDRSSLRCPQCGKVMHKHPYLGPGHILIDTCKRCNVIWLDDDELERAVAAPGSDRGIFIY